jgi:4'-phosphopantetheinyl transferase
MRESPAAMEKPRSPTSILESAAAAVALVVTARRGLVVRAGVELKSAEVAKLDKGVRCLCDEERDSDGKRRVRLINPIRGWASRKCLRAAWAEEAKATGCVRWVVDVMKWTPSDQEFDFLLALIPEAPERQQVMQYKQVDDRKRALVSRLLIRRCASLCLNLDQLASIKVARTKGRKPFLKHATKPDDRQNWNVNVSHEGRYVVLAAEPWCLCGVDVAAPRDTKLDSLKQTLTAKEWAFVNGDDKRFRALWACKEAFTKARGDGLGFPFGDAEFTLTYRGDASFEATVAVDGATLPDWRFRGETLNDHVCVSARGPVSAIVDGEGAFRRTMAAPLPAGALDAPWPAFSFLTPRDLVPDGRAAALAALSS